MFSLVDLILIVAVLIFVMLGFAWGLVQAIGALAGLIVGAWAAGQYYELVSGWLTPIILGHETTARIISFIVIFIAINRLVAFIFYILNKFFKLVSIIPFLKSIDRLAGGILGLVEGVLVVGLIVYVVAKFGADISWISDNLDGSKVAHGLVRLTSWLSAILPDTIETMKSVL